MDKLLAFLCGTRYGRHMNTTESRKYVKTKFEGIYYRESSKRNPKTGEYDRIYCFWYSDSEGKGHWKTVGRHSAGVRAATARNARAKFLAELATGINPVKIRKYTVGEAIEDYRTWMESEGKNIHSTYMQYVIHLKSAIHTLPIADLTNSLLSALRAKYLDKFVQTGMRKKDNSQTRKVFKKISPATVNKTFNMIRASINRAIATGAWVGTNPLSTRGGFWKKVPENNERLRFLSKEEAKLLLDYLKDRDKQLHDLVFLSLRTGLRPTEMFRLKGQDIDPKANALHIMEKGGRRTPVRVPEDIITLLQGYNRAPAEPIFQETRTKAAMVATPPAFRRAVEFLGLDTKDGDRLYRITLHTMRHTFASWLAQSGKASIMEVQKLMRHANITMTMRYAHLFPGQEVEKLSIVSDMLA